MIAKLIAAGVVIVAATAPAMAADIDVRADMPQAYVERQQQVYAPAEVVVAAPAPVVAAPLVRRRYIDPVDSNAFYGGPVVVPDDRYVVERTVRPLAVGPLLVDPLGPVCTPGEIVRAPDGRTWLCQ